MSRASRAVALALTTFGLTMLAGCDATRADGAAGASPKQVTAQKIPRLVDLGAGKCVPCKAMAPILEGLKAEYAGRMDVQFIDVWKDPEAGKAFGIHVIPTQIFYGSDGKELARHQGFMDKDAILAQWKAVGVSL
jgi:thioredoxin 1